MNKDTRPPTGSTPETSWSLIIAAKASDGDRARSALDRLCRLYWRPLYTYARRQGLGPSDAEDATQEFFAKILSKDWLANVEREKGRFRGFLFQSMSFHLSEIRRNQSTLKRGGGSVHVSLHAEAIEAKGSLYGAMQADPAACFDHAWACTALDLALERLGSEEQAAGRGERLLALRPYLTQPPTAGDYELLASRLGLARPTVAVLVHRLGKRYRELIRLVVAETLADPADLDSEIRHLLQSFETTGGLA